LSDKIFPEIDDPVKVVFSGYAAFDEVSEFGDVSAHEITLLFLFG
jgi:hypothetical protein